jgi:hypothetical protein
MKKQQTVLFLLMFAVLVCLAAVLWPREKQPKYEGKSLLQWILLHELSTGADSVHNSQYDPGMLQESEEAIRQIGTNALPWLIRWIRCEPSGSKWRTELLNAVDKLPNGLGETRLVDSLLSDPVARQEIAYEGFRLLGTNASAAVPELTRLVDEHQSPSVSSYALRALAELGPDGLPPVLEILANPNDPNRSAATRVFHANRNLGTNAVLAVRLLAECVRDTNREVAIGAAESLGRLGLEPETAVPALAARLQDPTDEVRFVCARSLAWFGERARPALPALTIALHDSNFEVRHYATNTLAKLSPEVLERQQ